MKASQLEVVSLAKSYPEFRLGPLSFSLAPGRACGLLGPNGAGKTTLLRCLATQSKPTGGGFRWRGRAVEWGDWRYREEICFMSETPALYGDLTASQMLRFVGHMYDSWDTEFARAWIARLRVPLHRKIATFSKGMRIKLALVAALAHRAGLFLLDEPTAGLDPDARAELQQLLREMCGRGVCVLISSHLFEDIELVCDDVKILKRGTLVYESELRALQAHSKDGSIRDLYFALGD